MSVGEYLYIYTNMTGVFVWGFLYICKYKQVGVCVSLGDIYIYAGMCMSVYIYKSRDEYVYRLIIYIYADMSVCVWGV